MVWGERGKRVRRDDCYHSNDSNNHKRVQPASKRGSYLLSVCYCLLIVIVWLVEISKGKVL